MVNLKRRSFLATLGCLPALARGDEMAAIAARNRAAQKGEILRLRRDEAARLYRNPVDPWRGKADGAPRLLLFTDYNCPYCRKLEASLDALLLRRRDLRVVYKPLALMADSSRAAASLALATWRHDPARFPAVNQQLMRGALPLLPNEIQRIARTNGGFWQGSDAVVDAALADNQRLADQLRVFSTPALLIDDTLYRGHATPDELLRALG